MNPFAGMGATVGLGTQNRYQQRPMGPSNGAMQRMRAPQGNAFGQRFQGAMNKVGMPQLQGNPFQQQPYQPKQPQPQTNVPQVPPQPYQPMQMQGPTEQAGLIGGSYSLADKMGGNTGVAGNKFDAGSIQQIPGFGGGLNWGNYNPGYQDYNQRAAEVAAGPIPQQYGDEAPEDVPGVEEMNARAGIGPSPNIQQALMNQNQRRYAMA